MIEAGVLGLEDEIVGLYWQQLLNKRPAAHAIFEAVVDDVIEFRLPAAEIVVDVDGRNTGFGGAFLERGYLWRDFHGLFEELLASRKFEVVNDVDQQQSYIVCIWGATVQIVLRARFRCHFY